jgi:hypothetical protein
MRQPRYGPAPPMRGAALPLWSRRADLVAWATSRLDEQVALGATCVELVVMGRQRDRTASELGPSPTEPSAAEFKAIVAAARARHLDVLLLPIIELEHVEDGAWRGTIAPADLDRWWASYLRFILRYAELAAASQVSWLAIGSELGSTEAWRDRWYHLISQVRQVFPGKLLYSANWDHYEQVSFWARLDAIGVSSYFGIAATSEDSTSAMAQRWRRIQTELARFAVKLDKPLLLTELGYPSRDGATRAPWDYTREGPVDLEEQRRAFAAVAAAWLDNAVSGVMIWEISSDGGPRDPGYSPRGKPAWCVLAAWWRNPCTAGAP